MIFDVLAWLWLYITIMYHRFTTWLTIQYISLIPIAKAAWETLGDWAMESWKFRENLVEEWKED